MRADNDLLMRADQTLASTTRLCVQIVVTGVVIGVLWAISLAIGVGAI